MLMTLKRQRNRRRIADAAAVACRISKSKIKNKNRSLSNSSPSIPPPQSQPLQGMAYRSPVNPCFLSSNNDQLERAQARAVARAAALRRGATAIPSFPPSPHDPCLSEDQIIELFQNCIKLAAENKINEKNTWELRLIDHLSEIIKVETACGGYTETNFQKASCTLEAGVKIYSVRVDSVHSEAYKVLSGINRAGLDDEQKGITQDENISRQQDESQPKKESEKKISPLSTLESSFEALNAKKFDFAFVVDPLYHQTCAQFDEGGIKGLLLNNLGVYEACRVLFDSFEVPGKCKLYSHQNDFLDKIDISFANETIDQMVMSMLQKSEISPTLRDMICRLDEDNQRSPETFNVDDNADVTTDGFDNIEVEMDNNSFGNFEAWTFNHDNETRTFEERFTYSTCQSHPEDNHPSISFEFNVDQSLEDIATFCFQGLGITSKKNTWAGPDHWKFQKHKIPVDVPVSESGSACATKRNKNKSQAEVDFEFRIPLDSEMVNIFAPPKSLKSLLQPANRAPCSTILPEDYHYEPEHLVKLFLLPNVLCLEKKRRELLGMGIFSVAMDISCDEIFKRRFTNTAKNILWQQRNVFDEALPSWDNGSVDSGHQHNDEYFQGGEVADELVCRPRQVDKIEVQYDKSSKHVDVQTLKETLWDHIQESIEVPEIKVDNGKDIVSFKRVLATFPVDCQSTSVKDISPHLCFICLLHLANEHGLSIQDCPSLDDLSIHLPPFWQKVDGMA